VAQPVRLNNHIIGTVLVRADLGWFFSQFWMFVSAAVVVMLLMIGLAYFLSLRVQRVISRPIEELALSMEKVSRDNDYTVRVEEPQSHDEIAVLMTGFNSMLAQIQKRDLELEHVSRQKDEFLRNMSHELRTPLNAVIGFSELLQSNFYGSLNDKQLSYVRDINVSGRHLLDLINEILDHAKIETGGFTLNPEECDLRELLDESLIMIRSQITSQKLRTSIEVDEHLPSTIVADKKRLKQVLYNLLANAVKFTECGGCITLRALRVSRDWVEARLPESFQAGKQVLLKEISTEYCAIMVEDTGIGIDSTHLRRIFMPFEQVENSVSRQYSGTGLGLALSKSFVEMHHGVIWAESELHRGSTFIFVIPLE
jgi:signal transduction histidine kinase